jgi:flagellar basal-body rod protein FlgB
LFFSLKFSVSLRLCVSSVPKNRETKEPAQSAGKLPLAAKTWRRLLDDLLISLGLPVGTPTAILAATMLDGVTGQLERYMDLLAERQKLVASNVANADTPGYQTLDVDFQSELRNAAGESPRAVEVQGLRVKNDGNNVSLDREARLLAENSLRFQIASSLMRTQIRVTRAAIEEGKS